MRLLTLFLILILPYFRALAALPSSLKAQQLITGQNIEISTRPKDKKGTVMVFMSAKCPCSDSHISVIKQLVTKYPDFRFYVIHSNLDETAADSLKYFKKAELAIDVIQDKNTEIADLVKAYKTPHAFIFDAQGETKYQGGVTDSSNAASSTRNYLDEALADLQQNVAVRTPESRTLGCVIMRQNELPK